MSLTNKTILITRSEDQADDFIELIESRGGKAILFPTIKITDPDDWQECDRAIKALNSFDGIIFTSRNSVEKFIERMNSKNIPLSALRSMLFFAVGEKTKSTIEKHNLKCFSVPETYTAENLADNIKTIGVKNKKFLFPRGNLGRDVIIDKLSGYGAEVKSVVVYKTERAIPENLHSIEAELLEGKIDVVTFTSPSTVKNFFSLFSENTKVQFTKQTIFAVIGKVTAEVLRKFGIEPAVIAKPSTIEGMVEGMERNLSA
ncbi:MAG: uroporphyrinogen-III synthase [Bacteroidota bacterium]|nr:uroporphyrinogen-III synthase [Bacteroidota bacterium]